MIITLTQGILEVGEQQKTFAGEALKDMISIKYMLISSRNGLNGLALRTVLTVDNLKAVSEAFFAANDADVAMTMADKMEYITEMMTDMTNLIQNTNKHIKEANEIYADVRKRMISIVAKLRGYKWALEQLLSNKTLATDNSKVIFSVLALPLTSLKILIGVY